MIPTILCVYCCKPKPRPAKGEHIILKGLRGRATIINVCGGPDSCNQTLGDELDIEMLRNSFIALHRYYDPKVLKGQVGGTQFLRSRFGGFYDCKMFNSGQPHLLPQVVLADQGAIVAVEDDDKPAADVVLLCLKGVDTVFKEEIVGELELPAKYEQPARGEVAGGLLWVGVGQAAGSGSGCSFLRARRALA